VEQSGRPQYLRPYQASWFWITGKVDNKTVLLGKYNTREEANEVGFRAFDGVFEVHELPTISKPAASSMLKHILFQGSGDLRDSMKPVRHAVPSDKHEI